MRRLPILLAIAVVGAIGGTTRAADDVDADVAKSRELVQAFAKTLKAELQQAMEAGGPTNAIGVCHEVAPEIAREQSESSGWDVGRTALRLRNPMNAPDDWERATLEQFEARKVAGQDTQTMERHETVSENGETMFRYMKAIPTAELCTNCHGTDLAPKVEARLAELYPEDRAIGFAVGDIRGAFTLEKPLD
ncbi:MAG: DUF3365 domain-containing protein [Alphaproteobacteria bacterium]|nr:DUF3365 domain-containing protein [Alphaproteobacteria bacterium]